MKNICTECACQKICAYKLENPKNGYDFCNHLIPFCSSCSFHKEIEDEETKEKKYFCSLRSNSEVDPKGYCSEGKNEENEKGKEKIAEKTPMQKHINIYTDGACKGNPGPGGWAAILICEGREKEIVGGEKETTNNRMELMAVISALAAVKEPCEITLTTDSSYVVNAVEKGWLKNWASNGWRKSSGAPVLNPDLWKSLCELLEKHKVKFVWIKGHAGHKYNERCDNLASNFANSVRS